MVRCQVFSLDLNLQDSEIILFTASLLLRSRFWRSSIIFDGSSAAEDLPLNNTKLPLKFLLNLFQIRMCRIMARRRY